jgi:hypothetical protein
MRIQTKIKSKNLVGKYLHAMQILQENPLNHT